MKILFLILSILISACGKKNNEWETIFDGEKVDGMRGYKMDSFPWESWEIIDGSLKTIPDAKGVDIISEKVFKDFELELEWKIQKGSNSGIFYFASEEGDYIWQSAPEMQVLDNTAHPDRQKKETSAGALYDLNVVLDIPLSSFGTTERYVMACEYSHSEPRRQCPFK